MSTRADSTKKPNAFNDTNELLYDPYPGFPVSELYTTVPWPEWNDAELNTEAWDESKGSVGSKSSAPALPANFFEDSDPPKLPGQINEYVDAWKRPHKVFVKSNICVYDPGNLQFTLTLPSPVAECPFFASFNELLPILYYYGLTERFSVEMETPNYVPTTQGENWKPWHHVYALSKAGKGQVHKPLYCPYGKYVLRLFHLGCWRKLVVDDRIPCDKHGLSMLPVTQSRGELWPILLAKGLLKIIGLTGTTMDFPFYTFFTGWVGGCLNAENKSPDQIWRRMQVLTPRFELPLDDPDTKTVASSAKGSSKKESSMGRSQLVEIPSEKFCILVGYLGGFVSKEAEATSFKVIVTMNRDLPLMKACKREETKAWKRLRWVYWASKKGIWTDERLLPPYRRLQYITYARRLSRLLLPDPIQEATLYEIPGEDSLKPSQQHLGSGDVAPFEPKQWSEFYKFYEHLSDLNVLFKPSCFLSNFKMTCLSNKVSKKDSATPATAKTAPKVEPSNLLFYSPELTPTLNQPLLMYCESSSGIFICFSLWVCPVHKKLFTGYLDTAQPEVLKVGHGSLIIEQFDWRTLQQGDIVGYTKTVGNSFVWLNLKPGRHAFRIWLNADSPYAVNIFSNVDLFIHKGPKIRFQMKNECEKILSYIADVSNAFIALTLKFGKSDLPESLSEFYQAIKPGNDSAPNYSRKLDDFIETFLNATILALKNLIPSTDEVKIMLGAMRSLFVNPNIHCDLPPGQPASLYGGGAKKAVKKGVAFVRERTLSEILSYNWTPEEIRQITFIQKMFRGYRTRLLLQCQTPSRKEFRPYAERLKKICDTIFVPAKRDFEVGRVIRIMVELNSSITDTFKFYRDFPNVVDVDEFSGKVVGVEPFAWVPLARFIVASHSQEFVPCTFYLSCNLEQFVVAGVNNDTNEEVFSLANAVSPGYYQPNTKGYTIFVFGWNGSSAKTVNWRLEMVKMKHFESMHLCNTMLNMGCHPYPMPSIEVNEIKNFYIPNQRSRLCRCSIKIQKRSLLTLRLTASFPEVKFVLTVSLDKRYQQEDAEDSSCKNPVVAKAFSINGAAFISSIVLENVQKSEWWDEGDDDATFYVLEAHILNDSWPLTKQEWGIIEPLRVNGETWKDSTSSIQLKKGVSESRRKLTRMSKRSLQERNVENPCWLLQVLGDSSEGDSNEAMTVEEDRTYQDSVKAMKILWEEKNPGRRKKGRDLRLKFLHAMYLENQSRQLEEESEQDEMLGEADRFDNGGNFQELLHKMASFSYLTNDKSTERFLISPRILPWMPTEELLMKYKSDCGVTSTVSSSDMYAINRPTRNVSEEEEEDRREFLTLCNHYRLIMVNHLAEEQKISNQLMEQAYKLRTSAVQRMAG